MNRWPLYLQRVCSGSSPLGCSRREPEIGTLMAQPAVSSGLEAGFIGCEEGNSMIVNAATKLLLGREFSCSGDRRRRRHGITGRSQRNGQQRIEMAAVADHETFDKTQGPSLVTYLIQIDTCREQIRPSIPHDPDDEEWRFGGDVICAARDDHRQADDMAIVLPLVDIGSPE